MKHTLLTFYCHLLWSSFILFTCSSPHTSAYAESSSYVTDHSVEQLVVEAGTDTFLTCDLATLNHLKNPTNGSSKELTLTWKRKTQANEDKWTTLPYNQTISSLKDENYVLALNLSESNFTLTLQNISVAMSGWYACFASTQDVPLNQIVLKVGYPPEKPSYLQCITNGLVTKMICSWNLKKQTNIPTEYKIDYDVKIRHSWMQVKTSIAVTRRTTCTVSNRTYYWINDDDDSQNKAVFCSLNVTLPKVNISGPLVCNVTVNATNALGNVTKLFRDEYPASSVRTNPPTNVTIGNCPKAADGTSSCLLVSWNAPTDVKEDMKLEYIVSYRETNATNWKIKRVFSSTNCLLKGIDSYTYFDVQVQAAPSHDREKSILYSGSPSDYTPVVTSRTSLKAPIRKLVFSEINVTKLYFDDHYSWEISLKWVVYNQHHEPGFYYEIVYEELSEHKPKQFQFHVNRASFNVFGNTSGIIYGKHCNVEGCSPPSEPKRINFTQDMWAVDGVQLNLSDNNADITWEKPYDVFDENNCIARVCAFHRKGSDFASIFYNHEEANNISDYDSSSFVFCEEVSLPCTHEKANVSVGVSPCYFYIAYVLRAKEISDIQNRIISSKPFGSTVGPKIIPRNLAFDAEDYSVEERYQIKTSWNYSLSQSLYEDNHLLFSLVYSTKNIQNKFETYHERVTNSTQTELLITSNIYGGKAYDLGLGYCCPSIPTQTKGHCFSASNYVTTVRVPPSHSSGTNFASLTIGLSVTTLILLVILILAQYYRRNIKIFIRKHFWPKVPVPDIYVHFFSESNELSFESNQNSVKDLFSNRHLDVDSSLPEVEVPDDITECQKEVKKEKDQTRESPKPKSSAPNNDQLSKSSNTERSSVPHEQLKTPVTGKIQISEGKKWRKIVYPTLQKYASSSAHKQRRPHSYAGNITTSFEKAGYLRKTNPKTNRKNRNRDISRNDELSDSITYSKLALNLQGKPNFVRSFPSCGCTDKNGVVPCGGLCCTRSFTDPTQNSEAASSKKQKTIGKGQNEQWCDKEFLPFVSNQSQRNSNLDSSSTASDPQDYVGTTASYIIAPTDEVTPADQFLLPEDGKDMDAKISLGMRSFNPQIDAVALSDCFNAWPSRLQNNASAKNLRPDIDDFTLESCNFLDANDSTNASQEEDLLTYIQEKESYVTIDEALHRPEHSNDESNLNNPYGDDLNSLAMPEFYENDSADLMAMSSAISRLLDDISDRNYDEERTDADLYDEEDGAYITEAETTKFCV